MGISHERTKKAMAKESKAGERVRTYRERLDMSIYDLSQKSGISEDVINSIEKGEVLPALGVLTKLSRALGQRLGTFMDDQFKPDPIITRAKDLDAQEVAKEGTNVLGYASHSLALGKPDRHMDPFRIEFAADGIDEASSHEGEELIICISGKVKLTYGNESTVLEPGDTAYYNSVVKHTLESADGNPASIYGIVFMPF
jgi:transcriptional regulator with XRE-family HTH domain